MTFTGVALAVALVLLLAAWLRDEMSGTRTARSALRSAFDRGEMREEDYARGLQALDEPV